MLVRLFLSPTHSQSPSALYPWPHARLPRPQCPRIPLLYSIYSLILLLPIDPISIPLPQQWRREYSQGERCSVCITRTGDVYTDVQSILGFLVAVRTEKCETRKGCVDNSRGLRRWDRTGDWDGNKQRAGWRQGRRIMGLD